MHNKELVGLIGPNGSGKTTLFNCISGFERIGSGSVEWNGHDVTHWSPDRRSRAGLVRTFQQVMVFPEMSVLANIAQAIRCAGSSGKLSHADGSRQGYLTTVRAKFALGAGYREAALRTADIAGLGSLARASDAPVSELSHGSQRLLGVAMALATGPSLLMLDEPAAGLHDDEIAVLGDVLAGLPATGVSVLVIDHNMKFLLGLCTRIVVLDSGEKLVEGAPSDVIANPKVIDVYLGSQFRGEGSDTPHRLATSESQDEHESDADIAPLYVTKATLIPSGNDKMSADKATVPAGSTRLSVNALMAGYGSVTILRDISISLGHGEVITILGPNGAGKTTLLRSISGAARVFSGIIEYDGQSIVGRSPNQIVRLGIAHVLEGRRVFASLTVEENLRVADLAVRATTESMGLTGIYETFPDLYRLRRLRGDQLSGGQQQQLAIARALMSNPQVLLLDEPSLGLSPLLVDVMLDVIRRVIDHTGVSVVLVEQAVWLAKEVAQRAYILENGSVVFQGPISDLDRGRMADLYFGGEMVSEASP